MKKYLLAIALLCPVAFTGCAAKNTTTAVPAADADLQKVSIGILDVAQGVATLQNAVTGANQSKLIPDDTTRTILLLCQRVNEADIQASKITRAIAKLDPAQRGSLLNILNPVLAQVTIELGPGRLIDIKDPGALKLVQSGLQTLQATLTLIQSTLGH